jgi:hypothetical protein
MGHYSKKLSSKVVIFMEVAEKKKPYTNVFFEDGTSIMTSYGISETIKRLNSNVVKINMSQAVNLVKVDNINGNLLTINNKKMKISRRKLRLFCGFFLAMIYTSFAQTAVNDTLKVCNDITAKFSVLGNDYPLNNIQLSTFTQPSNGELVALSNTGGFRYYWNIGANLDSFQYKIKLINTNTESSFATVVLKGSPRVTLSGNYPNTTLTNIEGCQITTNGTTTFVSGAKYKLEHYQFTELKPGTAIDAAGGGSVLIQAKK